MSASAPFPHLDALAALLDRAAGVDEGDARQQDGLGRTLFPTPFVTGGALMWPWEHAHRVLHEWAPWTREAPHDVTSAVRLVRLPRLPVVPQPLRGRALVVVELAVPGEPWTAAGRIARLRRLDPEIDTVGIVPPAAVPDLYTGVDVPAPAVAGHMALSGMSPDVVDAFLAVAGPGSGTNLVSAALRHLGPAYAMAATGIPADADDIVRIEIRLGLLAGRLGRYAAGRPAPAEPAPGTTPARPLRAL
jgi:hypothetical protein